MMNHTDKTVEVDEDRKKLADKVRALFAKANSTEHDAERDAFERKALALMAKHDLAERELADADREVGRSEFNLDQWGNAKEGVNALYQWVGPLFGCYVFSWAYEARSKAAVVYGTEAQVERFELMMEHLLPQLRHDLTVERPRSRKSFAVAWAHAVSERLKAAQAVVYSESRALVPTTVEAERSADADLMEMGARLRSTGFSATDRWDAASGAHRGDQADLGQGRVEA